ncbi:NADH dehydrogenase subunit E [Rhodobacter aestuarii]|uniref:NADH dehydrogenase subunit E n=1 Tax=Rhodobacter aestuarii TaxID=453582 RepID=A0A1N7P5T8_9RHOB|nr:NADH-quinone oxidoreductase subunit E [Rhodobacter aestuarii]PTV97613.1 NADH dehydrogenase subunit E [Rhodobacter aestuarii]SIT06005.1 NADH dehydrogenase subunit E [Rhodobacter aestuarii]
MLRRLHHEQPESFAFTPANLAWAEAQMTKYPEGRQASAIIPLLFRAQEQEGWLSKPAIEYVADMLGLPYIRALEVATFYFMFQLQPVGSVAHIQICGTTSCMICGAEDLMAVCKSKIAAHPFELSEDGKFSWEEVECLGACANAPMAQIGKDYYEDLTEESLAGLLDALAKGETPRAGSQTGRFSSEPAGGLTACMETAGEKEATNGSVTRALSIGDGVKRIDGTEVPLSAPWQAGGQLGPIGMMTARPKTAAQQAEEKAKAEAAPAPKAAAPAPKAAPEPVVHVAKEEAPKPVAPKAEEPKVEPTPEPTPAKAKKGPVVLEVDAGEGVQPQGLDAPRGDKADDLKTIEGIGPVLEALCNDLGIYHFDQIAKWGADEIAWMDSNLKGFKGRVTRDKWVAQAKIITEEGVARFLERAKTNDY